jgi:hypothetical protein
MQASCRDPQNGNSNIHLLPDTQMLSGDAVVSPAAVTWFRVEMQASTLGKKMLFPIKRRLISSP